MVPAGKGCHALLFYSLLKLRVGWILAQGSDWGSSGAMGSDKAAQLGLIWV